MSVMVNSLVLSDFSRFGSILQILHFWAYSSNIDYILVVFSSTGQNIGYFMVDFVIIQSVGCRVFCYFSFLFVSGMVHLYYPVLTGMVHLY